MAQVLVVKYENQADAKVFETPYESQADLAVLEVPYEQQATGDAVWHMVHYESQATFKIFKVKYEAQADLRIFKVKHLAQAGWRTQGHVLEGKLGKLAAAAGARHSSPRPCRNAKGNRALGLALRANIAGSTRLGSAPP